MYEDELNVFLHIQAYLSTPLWQLTFNHVLAVFPYSLASLYMTHWLIG